MDRLLAFQVLYDVLLVGCCGYAFIAGGRDERLGALMLLSASVASALIAGTPGFTWRHEDLDIMLIDVAFFVAIGWLASISTRFWPLWATAFQLNDIMTDGLMILAPHRILHAYVLLQGFWAYPIMAVIMMATRNRRRAIRSLSSQPFA